MGTAFPKRRFAGASRKAPWHASAEQDGDPETTADAID
jgi:hypothetical protein